MLENRQMEVFMKICFSDIYQSGGLTMGYINPNPLTGPLKTPVSATFLQARYVFPTITWKQFGGCN